MSIKPTPQTYHILRSYGLLLKEVGGVYVLFAKEDDNRKNLIYGLKDPLKLSFYVFCEDQWLFNYSDLDLEYVNQGYLLKNRYNESSLHLGNAVSDEEKVMFVESFATLSNYIGNGTAVSIGNTAGELFSGTYQDFLRDYSLSSLCEMGYFEVSSPLLEVPLKCYGIAPSTKKPFGVVELSWDSQLLKPNLDFSYKATIASKAVVWRYLLVNREPLIYKDFKLYNGKSILSIKDESMTVLSNGDNAYILETMDPIPITEQYEHLYELEFVKQDPKTQQITARKRVGLPVPDITKVKIAKSDRGYKAYSDMYIYL